MRLTAATLDDVAQGTLVAGIAQVWSGIHQQVDAALIGALHVAQGGAEVGCQLGCRFAIHVDPAQAFGDTPAVQRAPDMHQRLPEQVHHPAFVGGFDYQQRGVGADQRH